MDTPKAPKQDVQTWKLDGGLTHHYILNDVTAIICIQSNCVAMRLHPQSLNQALFKKLGYGDPYSIRVKKGKFNNLADDCYQPSPGSIKLFEGSQEGPAICSLFAQYNMGDNSKLYYENDPTYLKGCRADTKVQREMWFEECLKSLGFLMRTNIKYKVIYMPWGIGCTVAGGDWTRYHQMISDFSETVNQDVYIIIQK